MIQLHFEALLGGLHAELLRVNEPPYMPVLGEGPRSTPFKDKHGLSIIRLPNRETSGA